MWEQLSYVIFWLLLFLLWLAVLARALVVPAKRGSGKRVKTQNEAPDQTPAEKRASMTWAQRLKRVFNIDIETCSECGGNVKIIASIEAHYTTGRSPQGWRGIFRPEPGN